MSKTPGNHDHHGSRTSVAASRRTPVASGSIKFDGKQVLVLGVSASGSLSALLHADGRWTEASLPVTGEHGAIADLILVPYANRSTIGRVVMRACESADQSTEVIIAVPKHDPAFTGYTVDMLTKAGFARSSVRPSTSQTTIFARKVVD